MPSVVSPGSLRHFQYDWVVSESPIYQLIQQHTRTILPHTLLSSWDNHTSIWHHKAWTASNKTGISNKKYHQSQVTPDKLPNKMQRAMSLSTEKGSSSWLSILPITEHGFALHESAFCDALCLAGIHPMIQDPKPLSRKNKTYFVSKGMLPVTFDFTHVTCSMIILLHQT